MMNGIDGPVETTPIIEEVEYQVHKALSLVLLKHGGGLLRLPKKYSADDIKSMVKVPDNLDPVDVLGKLAEDNHKELLDHLISKNLPCMLTEFGGFYLDRHKSSLENIATISSLWVMKTPQEDVEFRMYPLSRRRADAMSNAIGSAVCNICPLNKEGLCTPEPSRRFTGLIDDAKTYYPSIVIK